MSGAEGGISFEYPRCVGRFTIGGHPHSILCNMYMSHVSQEFKTNNCFRCIFPPHQVAYQSSVWVLGIFNILYSH